MQFPIATVISIPLIVIVSCWNPDEPENVVSPMPSAIQKNAETNREKVVTQLSPFSFIAGDWRGVAQPKRGSNAGAWSEKAHAAWRFNEKIPCLVFTLKPGEKSSCILLATASETGRPLIEFRQPGQPPVVLEITEPETSAKSNSTTQVIISPGNHWVFESTGEQRVRITIRKINEIRMTMLFEESTNAKSAWRRQYEIGLTREGERLASGNASERECVVTGGLGTISVSHAGKTYYVCCEGCKQAFEADPEGTLTAYRTRLKQKSP